MAKKGDTYTVELNKAHLNWGTHRYTETREKIEGERYIPIPAEKARELDLLNSNGTNKSEILGKNIFRCVSEDGSFNGILKAQGCKKAGDIYAKQFSVQGDLKALGTWFYNAEINAGDTIEVEWISNTDIVLKKL